MKHILFHIVIRNYLEIISSSPYNLYVICLNKRLQISNYVKIIKYGSAIFVA